MKQICVCEATDKELREFAKLKDLPLKWLRGVKRMHRRLKIHTWKIS